MFASFRKHRDTIFGLAGAAALAAYAYVATPRIHPETITVPSRKVEPPSREMRPFVQPLLGSPPPMPPHQRRTPLTIVAPLERAPHERPEFGSDVARNTDPRHTVDTFHELPLESLGRTVLNEGAYEEILDQEEAAALPPIRADRRVKMLRLRILRMRDAAATKVQIGAIRFFWGMSRIVDPGLVLWNPHTGERTPYDGGAWSDDDQRTAVFIFTNPVEVTRYQFLTASANPGLDPSEWILEGSRNGTFWTELDVHGPAGSPMPIVRNTWINYPIRATT